MLKITIFISFLFFFLLVQAHSNGDQTDPLNCQKCKSKECEEDNPVNPDKCKSNQCIVCVDQQRTDNDAIINQIHQGVEILRKDVADIKFKIGESPPEPPSKLPDIFNILGLILSLIGTFLVGIEFLRRPKIDRKLDVLLEKAKKKFPRMSMSSLLEKLEKYYNAVPEGEEKIIISEAIENARIIEKRLYGRIGLFLILLGFFGQILAVVIKEP